MNKKIGLDSFSGNYKEFKAHVLLNQDKYKSNKIIDILGYLVDSYLISEEQAEMYDKYCHNVLNETPNQVLEFKLLHDFSDVVDIVTEITDLVDYEDAYELNGVSRDDF